MTSKSYQALAAPVEFVHEEKRSTFTAMLYPVESRAQAMAYLEQVKEAHPGASHYCWAYIIGSAEQPVSVAFSDDGEPSGTAGKPMLNVLTHRQAGNCFAVIVRVFGGVKLGAGGLVRAYGAAVSQALDSAQWELVTELIAFRVEVSFALEERVRHRLQQANITVDAAEYGEQVTLFAKAAASILEQLEQDIPQLSSGSAKVITE